MDRYGLWWHPEFPQHKVKGKLTWSGDQGGTLELQSAFPDPAMKELELAPIRPYTTDIILGEVEPNLLCTLYRNLTTRLGPQPHFHSTYLMEGAHFAAASDIRVSRASFRIRHLEEWTTETPLERTDDLVAALKDDPCRLRLKPVAYRPTPLLDSAISHPHEATISITATYTPKFGFRRFVFNQVARVLVVAATEAFTFDELLTLVDDCSSLFTLLMAEKAGAFDLSFHSEVKGEDQTTTRVNLIYPRSEEPERSDFHPDDMLLALSHLKNASTVISNWMNKAPKLRRGANWLIANTRVRGFPETEFLSYVQAAETLHRVLVPSGQFVDSGDYRMIEAALISSIPPGTQRDLKQKFTQMLVYGNELSLRRRLRDLLKIIFPTPAREVRNHYADWCEQIVETRNYFIHNDPESANKAASGQRLFELTCQLRGLVTAVLLHEVGAPLNAVLNAISWRGWYIKM
jgi:ApeA-like protein/HEPN superfamily Apea-like protein